MGSAAAGQRRILSVLVIDIPVVQILLQKGDLQIGMAVLINPMNRRISLILIVSSIHDNRRLIFLCQDKIVCQRHPLLRRCVALYQKNYQSQHNDGSDSPNYPTQSAIPRLSARSLLSICFLRLFLFPRKYALHTISGTVFRLSSITHSRSVGKDKREPFAPIRIRFPPVLPFFLSLRIFHVYKALRSPRTVNSRKPPFRSRLCRSRADIFLFCPFSSAVDKIFSFHILFYSVSETGGIHSRTYGKCRSKDSRPRRRYPEKVKSVRGI